MARMPFHEIQVSILISLVVFLMFCLLTSLHYFPCFVCVLPGQLSRELNGILDPWPPFGILEFALPTIDVLRDVLKVAMYVNTRQ
jgi:hypothetical protein